MPRRRTTLTFYCWLCALTALAMTAAMAADASTTWAAEAAIAAPPGGVSAAAMAQPRSTLR